MWFKLKICWRVLRSESVVMVCTQGYYSYVNRYDDKHFWQYLKEKVKTLERQHYQLSKYKDENPSAS